MKEVEITIPGVANGSSKTLGLAKFQLNFSGLTVSFSSSYVGLAVLFFVGSCLGVLIFRKAKRLQVLICLFTCLYYLLIFVTGY